MNIRIINENEKLPTELALRIEELHAEYLRDMGFIPKEQKPSIRLKDLLRANRVGLYFNKLGQAVGYCLYRNLTGSLKIRAIYTVPAARGVGIAAALLGNILENEPATEAIACAFNKKPISNFFKRMKFTQSPRGHDNAWSDYTRKI